MNKKLTLLSLALLSSVFIKAQLKAPVNACGTEAPSQQWESWFSAKVEKYKEDLKNGQARMVNYTIPVIVHVIHFGEAVGTFPNIDSNQVKSQIQVMNDDFNAAGLNYSTTPSSFINNTASTGLHFCRAKQDPQGQGLVEPGIHRVSAATNVWTSPATATLNLQSYFNSVIIPATIWDPTKYLNIWVSDKPAGYPINGFATYPSGTGLTGLFNGNTGTSTNDGIWVWGKTFGTVGTIQSPYDKGRTAVHELGHWLGLRHIWGDGNCLSDYVSDTPPQKAAHYGPVTSTPINQCGNNLSPNGEMCMNFMDMTDDQYRYMFTNDQNVRIQTAMGQCVNRNILGTHGICSVPAATSSSAVASFVTASVQCLGTPFTPFNTSSGSPNPSYIWSSSPAASFSPATTVAFPAITLNNPGTYTITLAATNSVSSSSYTMLVTATSTCAAFNLCLDSIKMIKNIDTLRSYKAPTNASIIGCQSGWTGYLVGTNCYKDREFAQYFPPSTYTGIPYPQINSAIVFFDSAGTKASSPSTPIKCKVYGGTVQNGPGAVVGSITESLSVIAAAPKTYSVGYLGRPYYSYTVNTKMIPYIFNFNSPVIPNSNSGFFIGIEGPWLYPQDTIAIMTNQKYNNSLDSSSWYYTPNGAWRNYRYGRGYKVQLAILPQITCSPISGIKEIQSTFAANVNIMPNPNNGMFSLVFTLPQRNDIELTLFNSLGQQISKDKLGSFSNTVIDFDFSDRPNGIYFAHISNGTEKIINKIVIAH